MGQYILVDKRPMLADPEEWGKWMATSDRTVARDTIEGMLVSTVFLGMDHSFTEGATPVLFETMVFGNNDWLEETDLTRRYETWEQAEEGHRQVVARVTERGAYDNAD